MSKEQVTTIATVLISLIAILSFLFNINNQSGNLREQVATNTVAVMSNNKAIAELRDDVRNGVHELYNLILSHISGHNHEKILNWRSNEY